MRTASRCCAVLLLLLGTGACRQADPPPPSAATSKENRTPQPPSAASSPLLDTLAGFGGGRGLPVPEGLVPGGDCPPAPADAEQEIAAQAQAAVPLEEGLTLAYQWMRSPKEEYECLIQVKKVEADSILTSASCDVPEDRTTLRRICRADLRSAQMVHTLYGAVKVIDASGEEQPETITGATAFSLSSAAFAQLTQTGALTHRYVQLGPSLKLEKDAVSELRVEGRETMEVIVNDRPIELPVLKASGPMKVWLRGERLEGQNTMIVLDDERFPLLIDYGSSNDTRESRISFSTITYPRRGRGASGGGPLKGGGNPLERALIEHQPVDVYGIYFDFNSDRIRPESEPVLQEIGDIMRRHPDWGLNINGHTDNIGGDGPANLDLSRRRSQAVRKALISRFGITADRLSSGGHGAASPKDTNDTPRGRARNRRVELSRR